jgi:hypothetical protein
MGIYPFFVFFFQEITQGCGAHPMDTKGKAAGAGS